MSDSSAALRSLRKTFERFPVDWVLWAMDPEGVFRVHEGPGVRWKGVEPGECVGQCAWDLHGDSPRVVSFTRAAMRCPATDHLVFNDHRFLVSGAPTGEGGAIGIALAIRPAAAGEGERPVSGHSVIELVRSVPEVQARAGNLLLLDEEEPDQVGILGQVRLSELSPETQRELRRICRGALRDVPLRVRAPHLRLLP